MRNYISYDAIIEILDNGMDENGALTLNPLAAATVYKWIQSENKHLVELEKEAKEALEALTAKATGKAE